MVAIPRWLELIFIVVAIYSFFLCAGLVQEDIFNNDNKHKFVYPEVIVFA